MATNDSPSKLARAVFILLGLLLLGAAWLLRDSHGEPRAELQERLHKLLKSP